MKQHFASYHFAARHFASGHWAGVGVEIVAAIPARYHTLIGPSLGYSILVGPSISSHILGPSISSHILEV